MTLKHITDDVLRRAIRAQKAGVFDSHDIIFEIARREPRAYVEDLHLSLQDTGDPFINLHTAIGRRLAQLTGDIRQHHQKRVTPNVRGESSECEMWSRPGD